MSNAQEVGKWHTWTVADRLRAARESTGLNQKDFALSAGISERTVQNYESGSNPSPLFLDAWLKATQYSRQWIMTGIPPSDGDGDGGGRVVPMGRRKGRTQHAVTFGCIVLPLERAAA